MYIWDLNYKGSEGGWRQRTKEVEISDMMREAEASQVSFQTQIPLPGMPQNQPG